VSLNISNPSGDRDKKIANAANLIRRAPHRKKVFLAIYRGKRRVKTVSDIMRLSGLQSNKRVLAEGKKLASEDIVRQLRQKLNGQTAYEKIDFYAQNKSLIVNLALRLNRSQLLGSKPPYNRPPSVRHQKVQVGYGAQFIPEANANGVIYQYLYILENSLRHTILEAFKSESGWWTDGTFVDDKIREYSERVQKAESNYPWMKKRGTHPIYYVGLNELYKIITRNWGRFRLIFEDQLNLRTWFNELIPVRNMVAHNIPTAVEERKNVQIRTKYICTLIENHNALRSD
jgi:hypothetical protein